MFDNLIGQPFTVVINKLRKETGYYDYEKLQVKKICSPFTTIEVKEDEELYILYDPEYGRQLVSDQALYFIIVKDGIVVRIEDMDEPYQISKQDYNYYDVINNIKNKGEDPSTCDIIMWES